jgi:plastocyanin
MRLARRWRLPLVAAVCLAAVAPAVVAASATVSITDTGFDPASTTILTGEAVTWQNKGTRQHDVVADDGVFSSGPLDPGNQFANVFEKAGTFTYHSSIDSTFHGTVVVKAAPITPTPATFVPTPPAGTLPPGFSPHSNVTEAPVSQGPSAAPTPTSSAGTGAGSSGSLMPVIVFAVGILVIVILLRMRMLRSQPTNHGARRPRR